jgi:hypothetical protein
MSLLKEKNNLIQDLEQQLVDEMKKLQDGHNHEEELQSVDQQLDETIDEMTKLNERLKRDIYDRRKGFQRVV